MIQENFNDFDDPYVMAAAPGVPAIGPDGCVPLPSGPGLGVEVDEAVLAVHPARKVFFNLYSDDWQKRNSRPSP
jgi:galactonate dehydratase